MYRIPGHERYAATKDGRIYSFRAKRFLKSADNGMGYKFVNISGRSEYVHRLVAMTFLGAKGKFEVNHKDKNKQNNNITNLEIVNHSENLQHHYNTISIQDKFNGYLEAGLDVDRAIYALT